MIMCVFESLYCYMGLKGVCNIIFTFVKCKGGLRGLIEASAPNLLSCKNSVIKRFIQQCSELTMIQAKTTKR